MAEMTIKEMIKAKMEQALMLKTGISKETADWLLDSAGAVKDYVEASRGELAPHAVLQLSEDAVVNMRLNMNPKAAVSRSMHGMLYHDTVLADDVDKDVIASLPEPTFEKLPVWCGGLWT